jgi:AraC-like DNA-binding protein
VYDWIVPGAVRQGFRKCDGPFLLNPKARMTMLDTLIGSPNRARSRYPIVPDVVVGLRAADRASGRVVAEGQASRLRTANDPTRGSSDRRSIARRYDQTKVRSSSRVDDWRDTLEPLPQLAVVVLEEVTRFYNIVRQAGYEFRFGNDSWFVIDRRSSLAAQGNFRECRSEEGGDFSRPVGKPRYEKTKTLRAPGAHASRAVQTHYPSLGRAETSAVNCEASVFDPAGNLVGSLEILSIDPKQPVPVDGMTRAILQTAARAIEERLFRDQYRHEWIVMVSPDDIFGSAMLFAVDRYQHIVAADRYARELLTGSNNAFEAIARGNSLSLWALFEKDLALFRSKDGRDIPTQLTSAGTAETWSALITPPDSDSTPWREFDANLHTRPRNGEIGFIRQLTSAPVARGGLSPGVLRRVREYIDANLEADVGLDALAKVAGLSRCHFARAFKQSVGTTPHNFLMHRRFCKAVEFIADTNLPLAEIALAAGFSDQSHFSRRFRQYIGVSPSAFRRSQR